MGENKSAHPVLSTIVLNWNRSDLLRTTLDSYRATIEVPFELFIVDNGSDDDSRALIEAFCARCSEAVPILLDRNLGGEALNLGIVRSRGAFLHLCENDIEFLPGWSSHVLGLFSAFEELGQLSLFPPVPSDEEVWVVQEAVLRHSGAEIVYETKRNVGTTSILRRDAWGDEARVATISGPGGFRFPDDVGISDTVRGRGYFVAWADRRLVTNVGHSHTEFEERREYYRKNYESKSWLGVDGWERRIAEFERRPKPRRRSLLLPGRELLAEKSEPSEECGTPFLWSMIDGWTAEAETLEFLYGLVRLIKPRVCVETGTWHGHAAVAIGRALRENGFGMLVTLESDAENLEVARRRLERARLGEWVTPVEGASLEYNPPEGIDFLLLDSDLQIRGEEFLKFLPQINEGATVVFHDTSSRHQAVREAIADLVARGLLTTIEFATPRGLVLARYPGTATAAAATARGPEHATGPRVTGPTAFLVAGMHRSGTSALARVLNLHGVYLGESLLAEDAANERGYWEHAELWGFDDEVLARLGRTWFDPRRLPQSWPDRADVSIMRRELTAILRRDFSAAPLWGCKDPRLCRLLPLWKAALGELGVAPVFVLPLRDPYEVARSLQHRDGLSQPRALALWLRHVLDAERDTRGMPRAFVTYEQLLADWRGVVARIAQATGVALPVPSEQAAPAVEAFLTSALRHHSGARPGEAVEGGLQALVARVYETLGTAAADGVEPDPVALDAVGDELDRLEDAFSQFAPAPGPQPDDAEEAGEAVLDYGAWTGIFGLHAADGQLMAERMMRGWALRPAIHLVMPLAPGQEAALPATMQSLARQLYSGWGLTVVARAPCPDPEFTQLPNLEWRQVDGDPWTHLNEAVRATESDWVALIRSGDVLAPNLLFACADHLQVHPQWALIYTDSDCLDAAGNRTAPSFRPEADIDLLRGVDYLGEFRLVRRATLLEIGGYQSEAAVAGYDLALRVLERHGVDGIGHIAEVLYHRASAPVDVAACEVQRRAVLSAHLERCGERARIDGGLVPGQLRVVHQHEQEPPISVIVATRDDQQTLENCLDTLREATRYTNIEVLLVDEGSEAEDTYDYFALLERRDGVRVVKAPASGGRAGGYNAAAAMARGEYLLFVDRNTLFVQPQWLQHLLGHAQREGVGVVAPRILGQDKRVRHSAMILGLDGIAGDAFRGLSAWDPGYLDRAQTEQGFSAVPGACLMVRRALFDEVGGFDAARLTDRWYDVDLCLRVRERGYRIVWTPYALVGWQGSEAPEENAPDGAAEDAMFERWLPVLARDPAYNRNLSLSHHDFRPRSESTASWDPTFHDRPRILGVPADTYGCGEYRILAPLNALADAALAQCGFVAPQEGHPCMPSLVELERLEPDALLLQATLTDEHLAALARYRRFSRAFRVFDLEDLKTATPEKNSRRKFLFRDMKARIRRALECCDRLVVTTEPIAEVYRGMVPDIRVQPNYLARSRWGGVAALRRQGPRPRVGWAGGQQHQGDLELIIPVVEATADAVDWIFFGMCPDALRPYAREMHEFGSFDEYPRRLAALNLDLAVAPLEDHPFNVAKSNLRLLEYGVLGWPVVCTDLEPYRGAPVKRVANTATAWIEAIRERVHDLDAAEGEGDRLRSWVLAHWMLEDHLGQWLEVLAPEATAARAAVAGLGAGGAGVR